MTQITIPFKNTDTGSTFNQILDIHTRINNIRNCVADNVFLNFNLHINEFDIVEAGQRASENAPRINEEYNSNTLNHRYLNNIKHITFYIRPSERFTISDDNRRVYIGQSMCRFKHTITGTTINQKIYLDTTFMNLRNIISNTVLNNFGLDSSQFDIVLVGQPTSENGIPINEHSSQTIEQKSIFYVRPHNEFNVLRIKNIITGKIFIQHFESYLTIRNLRNIIQNNVLQKFSLENSHFDIIEAGHPSLENSDIIDENSDDLIGQNKIFCIKPTKHCSIIICFF